MADRILEVAERGASLRLQNHLLVLRTQEGEECQIPIAELECVILGISAVSVSGALMSELSTAGIPVIISDEKRMPTGMLLPLNVHYRQNQCFRQQLETSEPLRKRMWQTVVKAKLKAQSSTLKELQLGDAGIPCLEKQVRSGDPENVEARAAICYWRQLFGPNFRRDRDANDNNVLLNYGYTALRAMTARAICGAGLHPTVGLHHHNKYDAFCLADDMMEPYRPVIDQAVYRLNSKNDWVHGPSREERQALLGALQEKRCFQGEWWTVSDLLTIHARQLAASYREGKDMLVF